MAGSDELERLQAWFDLAAAERKLAPEAALLFERVVRLEAALREIGCGVRGDEAADIAQAALAA